MESGKGLSCGRPGATAPAPSRCGSGRGRDLAASSVAPPPPLLPGPGLGSGIWEGLGGGGEGWFAVTPSNTSCPLPSPRGDGAKATPSSHTLPSFHFLALRPLFCFVVAPQWVPQDAVRTGTRKQLGRDYPHTAQTHDSSKLYFWPQVGSSQPVTSVFRSHRQADFLRRPCRPDPRLRLPPSPVTWAPGSVQWPQPGVQSIATSLKVPSGLAGTTCTKVL